MPFIHLWNDIVALVSSYAENGVADQSLAISPTVIPSRLSSRAIRACSSNLAVFSQVFAEATPFYRLFEHLADEITSSHNSDSSSPEELAICQLLEGNSAPLTS
jgi:hypothetical protein